MAIPLAPAQKDCYNLPMLRGMRFLGTVYTLRDSKDYYARVYHDCVVFVRVIGSKNDLSVKRFFVDFDEHDLECTSSVTMADWAVAYDMLKGVVHWLPCGCGGTCAPSRTNMFARICVSCGKSQWPRMDAPVAHTKKRKRCDSSESSSDSKITKTSSNVASSIESDSDCAPTEILHETEDLVLAFMQENVRHVDGHYEKCTDVWRAFCAWAGPDCHVDEFEFYDLVEDYVSRVAIGECAVFKGVWLHNHTREKSTDKDQ